MAWGELIHTDARPLVGMLESHEEALTRTLGQTIEGWQRRLDVPDNSRAKLTAILGSYMVRVGDEAVAIQDRQWNRLARKDVQSFRAERIEWVRAHGAELARGLDDQMRARIRSIIEAGAEANVSPDKLRQLLARETPALPGLSPKRRAELIARTELHNAAMWAQEREALGLASRGAVLRKTWTATMDARTRLAHRRCNGQVRELEQDFIVGGARMSRPGDPRGGARNVIRCRCICRYIPASYVEEDHRRRAADMIRVARLAPPRQFRAEIARMTEEMDPGLRRVVMAAAESDRAWAASSAALEAARLADDAAMQDPGN